MADKLTYTEAGVDTVKAAALVGDIRTHVQRTQKQRQLMGGYGLFAAAFELGDYRQPVIVTGCDGVGTKLEVQLEHDRIEDAGKDLVAMSVNDILTTGGDPLMFLDYIGVAQLDEERITRLIAGMADYLEECGCILAGGETAEMLSVELDTDHATDATLRSLLVYVYTDRLECPPHKLVELRSFAR